MKKIFYIVIMCLALLIPFNKTVNAEEESEAAQTNQIPAVSSLSIDLSYGSGKDAEKLEGVSIGVIQSAELTDLNGAPIYTSTDSFKSLNIEYSDLNAAESEQAALRLESYVKEKKLDAEVLKTDKNGKAVFENLKPGIYLVYQTETTQNSRFEPMKPFIAAVPELKDGKWISQVQVFPKTSLTLKRPTPSSGKQPNTNVETNTGIYELMFFISLASAALLYGFYRWQENR